MVTEGVSPEQAVDEAIARARRGGVRLGPPTRAKSNPITSFMGLLFPGKNATLSLWTISSLVPETHALIPAQVAAAGADAQPGVFSNFSPPTSATATPGQPTPGRFRTSSAGARRRGLRELGPPRAGARRRLRRAAGDVARSAQRQAAPGGGAHAVRLAGGRPGRQIQPRLGGAGPEPHRQPRPDADPLAGGSASAVREHPDGQPGRPSRSGADRCPDLQLRAHQRGAFDAGRGLLPPGQALVAPAAREGRQEPRDAGAPQPRGVPRHVSRGWWKLRGAAPRAWWGGSGGEVKIGGRALQGGPAVNFA